jgi:integrase
MHVYKRKDSKYYWYKFEYRGVAYRGSTGVRDKPGARNIAAKVRLDVIEGRYGIERQKAAPLFKDAMAQFLEHTRLHNAAGTTRRYETSAKPLNEAFGKKPLDGVTVEAIERYKSARLKAQRAPATVNADLRCMKAMFNHFVRLKTLAQSPAAGVKLLPEGNEKTRVLSLEEERLYLAACPQPLHDVAILMISTGMRPEEIFRMKAENVNLEAGWVFNPYGKTKAARRTLSLTRRAADVLKGRLGAIEGEYVFPRAGDSDRPMTRADRLHAKALKDSGIAHCRIYDLRHTFATRAAESGVDLVTLAALLGHSKIQMVLRYAHPQDEHKALAIRKMEDFQAAKQMEEESRSELIQ